MVRMLLGPAFAVLKRISFGTACAITCALLAAPTLAAFLLLPSLRALPIGQIAVIAGLALLAVYALAAAYAFMIYGVDGIVRTAERIAAGELVSSRSEEGDAGSAHDADRLRASMMKMNTSLARIVRQVRTSAESIAAASQSISEGHAHLSQRTEEQAASIEETASGMEQLAASARRNADNCGRASTLSSDASTVAAKAAAQLEELTRTMQRIDASAKQVGEILATVEGIAFQTNILALNAAVEAARAGDQGRGFAVVASEVRSLAQRSATAAQEIKNLITGSLESAAAGGRLVDAAGRTMHDVVDSVQQVSSVIGDIALASGEQSTGVAEINRAIAQIDAATQQNAALVEEATTAAVSFQRETGLLLDVVGRFKLDHADRREQVASLVKRVAEHVRRRGADAACADLNARDPRFMEGEHYVFAIHVNGIRVAFPPDPAACGNNVAHDKDEDGRFFGRELLDVGRVAGSGWCDFKFLNPTTGRVEPKSVYVERAGDLVLGCGIYLQEHRAAPAPTSAPRLVPQTLYTAA